jgi:hypothetical protein
MLQMVVKPLLLKWENNDNYFSLYMVGSRVYEGKHVDLRDVV